MYSNMFLVYFVILFGSVVCDSEEDLGHNLNIGNAIDVFANYGDLSQVTQVISIAYWGEDDSEPILPFSEKNIRLFDNVTSTETKGDPDGITNMELLVCDTFDQLLDAYFQNFKIEGTDKPWKAFMGDWIHDEIMRTFGLEYDPEPDCCFVLVKLTKVHKTVKLGELQGIALRDYVMWATENLNITDPTEVRRFMKSYGTHYIDSYTTGNIVYQVFKYKKRGFEQIRSYISKHKDGRISPGNLSFYFSSYFLKQVGDIRIASGNKTIETWVRKRLRDVHYLYSRPSLLRLNYNSLLVSKLNNLMDSKALIGISLKTLRPLFKDKHKADMYAEIVENDLRLWEVNA